MKKNIFEILVSASALLGMAGLVGCAATDEDAAETNPNYDAVANTVLANFAFNVAGGTSQQTTRMTGENVQAEGQTFRGMQDVKLIALQLGKDGSLVTEKPSADKVRVYDLGQIIGRGQIGTGTTAANNSDDEVASRRVVELPLPVNTNAVLFYGRAFKDGNALHQGVINGVDGNPTSGSFTQTERLDQVFSLTKRLESKKEQTMKDIEALIAGICTRIVQNGLHREGDGSDKDDSNRDLRATFWWPEPGEINEKSSDNLSLVETFNSAMEDGVSKYFTGSTWASYVNSRINATDKKKLNPGDTLHFYDKNMNLYVYYYKITKEWREYGEDYEEGKSQSALEEILGRSFHELVSYSDDNENDTEVRAGSGAAIARTMTDLWFAIKKIADATPTNYGEKLATLVAKRIDTRFGTYFDGFDSNNAEVTVTWKANTQVEYEKFSGEKLTSTITADDLNNFPENLELPMGAAQIIREKTPITPEGSEEVSYYEYSFTYNPEKLNFKMGSTIDINTLMYPSELMYYGNSPLRVSAKTRTTADYPDGVQKWANPDSWTESTDGWEEGSHVKSSTRSVAMIHEVNYGNALLQTTVKMVDGALQDNRKHFFPTEENATIDGASKNFTLTGILIGGQPASVDWQYLPVTPEDGATFSKTIYDRVIVDGSVKETASKPTYTMVFDNYDKTKADDKQNTVYVALEFKNGTMADFWGDHNIVRKDGTFYLVGKLNPTDIKTTTDGTTTGTASEPTWPETTDTYRSTPPYDDKGKTRQVNRVFIQDFVTKANFTIGETSLQKAYVTVPDLRSAEISFGLSVDLEWESGMEFDVILGQ